MLHAEAAFIAEMALAAGVIETLSKVQLTEADLIRLSRAMFFIGYGSGIDYIIEALDRKSKNKSTE